MNYEPVIGLEIHAELKTKSKMFCACKNDPDERDPNVNICPVCTGQPGTLPAINEAAVNHVVRVGLALGSEIGRLTKWDRKNYFYPDLPKGYQISQFDKPICLGGELALLDSGRKIKIRRVHLEEDTGRLAHFGHIGHSLIDLNRAGMPLMELVTEPDLKSGEEASGFAKELRLILKYLGVSDAEMEHGQMRVEANLSLKKPDGGLGVKVEVKNLNSFKTVRDAIDFEIGRQTKILDEGKKVVQETRGWNESKGETVSQRIKEESHDYRYFPEPDLPPLEIDSVLVEKFKADLPELPADKRKRFKTEYGLAVAQADILAADAKLADFFEEAVSESEDAMEDVGAAPSKKEKSALATLAANYVLGDFLSLLNEASASADDTRITAENFGELMALVHQNQITSTAAKEILKEMWATGENPSRIVEEKNLSKIDDAGIIEKVIEKVITANQKAVEDYKNGKEASLQFLVGVAMKELKGAAEAKTVADALKKFLK